MAVKISIVLEASNIDEALDALTGLYLKTENEALMKELEDARERLANQGDEGAGDSGMNWLLQIDSRHRLRGPSWEDTKIRTFYS
jgi:ribosomal 50S subunit-associated protein YjgA (DUF615 family)